MSPSPTSRRRRRAHLDRGRHASDGHAALEAVPGDVEVAGRGQDVAVVDSDRISDRALQRRDYRPPDDRHAQDPRRLAGVLAEAVNGLGKDGWEHDRVEEADTDD